MAKLIIEFQLTSEKEIDDFLLEACTQLAINKVNDKNNIASIIAENKAKMSQRLAKLRGKKIDMSLEMDNFKLDKARTISQIASKFLENVKKDLWKGEEYRFRDISIPEYVNSKNGEYMEINMKNSCLFIRVLK